MNVLNNVLEGLEVQKIFLAEEIKTKNPQMLAAIKNVFLRCQLNLFFTQK